MALQYVGVNLSGLEFGSGIGTQGSTYVLPSEDNYTAWAQNAGSNIIRLPFTWERLQPLDGGPLDQTYLNYLKSSVAYAQAHGETIILDMHNYGLYNGAPATAAQLSDVWTKLGTVFNGNSSVWFDLMNEPNNISATQWESVEQQTVNAMRADGISNKLLLEGTAWSGAWTWITSGNAAAFANFKDPANNYAYDVHQYLDSDGSGTSSTAVTGSGSTRLVDITNWAESTGHKLFLGETGLANNSGSETEMKAMITYMNAHTDAWQGMTLWGAGPWWPQNYIYNVNPTGLGTSTVTNASDITDMLSYLTPSASQTNSPPVAQADNFTAQENTTISGNVLANNGHGVDTDPNGLALSVTAGTLTTGHGGTVVLNADGSFTYHPASNFVGTDNFTYTLKDTGGLSSTGAVTLAVNAPSTQSAPVAQTDNVTAQQYHAINGNVLANNGNGADTDPNGLALSVTAAKLTTAHGGTVALNADGTFTYNPGSYYGSDSFTYTLKDSAGLSSTGTVNINVNPAPVAHPDDISGQSNAAISGNVLANNGHGADSDPVAATLSVAAAALTTAHGGQVSLQADGSFTYTSASGFSGTDSFNYVLLDGRGGQADGTVTLAVSPASTPVYTPPIAQPDNFSGQENTAVSGNVLANNGSGADTDPNGLALSVTAGTVATAHGGTAALNADGSFTYHPASNFYGADSFTYALHDTAGLSATGLVSIAVSQVVTTGPVIYGSSANDTLNAPTVTGTVIYGLGGNDVIHGNNGNDTLYGGDGNDKLYGGAGNDVLVGGAGADTMTGGSGNDVFKYNNVSEGGDIITDFHHLTGDTDTLDLTALFVANGIGSMSTSTAIQQHYLVLSQHADGLHVDFDKDGSGGAAAVHIATLSGTNQQHLDVLHQILTASS